MVKWLEEGIKLKEAIDRQSTKYHRQTHLLIQEQLEIDSLSLLLQSEYSQSSNGANCAIVRRIWTELPLAMCVELLFKLNETGIMTE